MNGPRDLPWQQCTNAEPHEGHSHVNGGPNGGCGLPEWCNGVTADEESGLRYLAETTALGPKPSLRDVGRAAGHPDPSPSTCLECGIDSAKVERLSAQLTQVRVLRNEMVGMEAAGASLVARSWVAAKIDAVLDGGR